MLRHPSLAFAKVGCNAQRKAFFAQQHVSAIPGVDGNDIVVLREMADIPFLRIDIAFCVKSLDPVLAVAQNLFHFSAHTGHNVHVQHDVDGVCDLISDFRQRRANRAHGIGNHVHRTPLIASAGNVEQHLIRFLWFFPVVSRPGILLLPRTDKRSILDTGHIVHLCPMEIAPRQFLLI